MQFKRNTTTISVGENTKPLFVKLESIRPKHLSFSLFLAVVVDDYLKNHKTGDAKITEFTDESIAVALPLFFSSIEKWKLGIKGLTSDDFKKLQQRHSQIGNIISKEVDQRL